MCVQRFDDFDLMVASDDGQYVLFEDYDLLDKQCEQQRATIQQLEARLAESEKAAYDIDETIQHQKQTISQLEAKLAELQGEA